MGWMAPAPLSVHCYAVIMNCTIEKPPQAGCDRWPQHRSSWQGRSEVMANRVRPGIEQTRAMSGTSTVRKAEWDSIRGTHQGQRSYTQRQQAGHKTASDQIPLTKNILLCRSHPHRTKRTSAIVRFCQSAPSYLRSSGVGLHPM